MLTSVPTGYSFSLFHLLDTLKMLSLPGRRQANIMARHKKKREAGMSLRPLPLAVFFPPEPKSQTSSESPESEQGKSCVVQRCVAYLVSKGTLRVGEVFDLAGSVICHWKLHRRW